MMKTWREQRLLAFLETSRDLGNYEVPFGFPLKVLLYEWAGGAPEGREIQAITTAGLSGGFIAGDDLDVTIDEPSFQAVGAMLGAAGIIVFDNTRDMLDVAHNAMEFFAEESCGKCFPCRIGTQRLTELLSVPLQPNSEALISRIGAVMKATSACGLGLLHLISQTVCYGTFNDCVYAVSTMVLPI